MDPPVGFGTGYTTGQMKQKNSSTSSTAAGIVISSVRIRPCARGNRRAATASSSGNAGDSASATGTAMADPGIEHVVEQVGAEIGEDHDRGKDQHDALDQRDIPVVDRLEQLEADAGQPEDLLHDHRRPDERGQV